MTIDRREMIGLCALGMLGSVGARIAPAAEPVKAARGRGLKITKLRVTPIALPDPPILAASGCHGPYFLRNLIEIETEDGIVGIGETHGGEERRKDLQKCKDIVVGASAFSYLKFAERTLPLGLNIYSGIELACLDAIGRATGLRLCQLLGGPVRESVEFASYLFFRYAADHPQVLEDPRLVDDRGRGTMALDDWGEVRTPEAMAEMAWRFHQKWGFRVHKLKAGVLPPDVELEALRAINARCGGKHPLRIDPNGRWTVDTAVRIGRAMKDLPIEYYEDPVRGQEAMAEVREKTKLAMSTNSCVTALRHIPRALRTQPVDVVLLDHHVWGGIPACQAAATMCQTIGWGVSQHSNNHSGVTMAAMLHLGAVVPQMSFASDTHYVWLPDDEDVIEGPKLAINRGKMQVPQSPGLGVDLDRDKVARAHERYVKCGMRGRDDAATMQRFDPGWKRNLF